MKFLLLIFLFSGAQESFGATEKQCLDGSFAACKEIFDHYGSSSNKQGAAELFARACASQHLRVACQITTADASETLKKTIELAKPEASTFVIDGKLINKIYSFSSIK